ncbi:hypothetical protein MHBO_000657 [Bonamia ostreae]|uniref:Uncharacterized protein n=1 Tax=Bonamia ostreae TaxID=126728 RepID=A0ABV2AHK9_9EUKA
MLKMLLMKRFVGAGKKVMINNRKKLHFRLFSKKSLKSILKSPKQTTKRNLSKSEISGIRKSIVWYLIVLLWLAYFRLVLVETNFYEFALTYLAEKRVEKIQISDKAAFVLIKKESDLSQDEILSNLRKVKNIFDEKIHKERKIFYKRGSFVHKPLRLQGKYHVSFKIDDKQSFQKYMNYLQNAIFDKNEDKIVVEDL